MVDLRLCDLLDAAAERHPERTFLTWGGSGSATYGEVSDAIQAQAAALEDSSMAGRSLGIMCHNRPELIVLWLACMKAGAVPVFLNHQLTADEVDGVIDDLELEVVFTDPELAAGTPRSMSLPDEPGITVAEPGLPVSGPDAPPNLEIGGVVLTSGSTGKPKYVPVPHQAYVMKATLNALLLGWRSSDAAYAVMPLFHVGGQGETVAPAIAAGARVDLIETFSASGLWADLERLGSTHLHATGSLLAMALVQGDPERPPTVRRFVASFRQDLAENLGRIAPDADLITLYGLTECPLGTISAPGEELKSEWVGYPYAGWDGLRLMREDGTIAPHGEEGEVQFRNPSCTPGYLSSEQQPPFTADGWLRTGDVGRRADGGLYLTGRIKEMIRRSGENIAPAQIEEMTLRHPAVVEAAAIAFPDPVRDEEVRLFVQLNGADSQLTEVDLRRFLAGSLARYKLPRYIDVVETMPKTPTGKVDKPRLAAVFTEPGWDFNAPD